jgi:hypothetical protein
MKMGFVPPGFVVLAARWAKAAFTLDARSLAASRIGLGLVLVADSLLRTRDFSLMLAPDGMFPLDSLARFHGTPAIWSLAFLHDSAWCSGGVLALEAVAGGALVVGWQSRLAAVAAWVAVVSLIRRASPSANAGDFWLACQLFWSMFLPLGARWSLDASRQPAAEPPPTAVCSVASAALVLQLAAVYLGAGLAKLNAGWLSGEALTHALSVHDHGTPVGMMLGGIPWLARPLQWLVVGGELVLPVVLLAVPKPRVRGLLVAAGWGFHLAIWFGMTVGLFAAIGLVAWLPLIPATAWPTGARAETGRVAGLGRTASLACGLALALATVAFVHQNTPWGRHSLPPAVRWPLNLTCLFQDWAMFGGVPAREQWVYGRAVLADGSEVDLLRGGRPLERERPAGGFTSLPHHRWHKFLWILPREPVRVFAPPAAAALVRHWNQTHPPDRQVTSLEIRLGIQDVRGSDDTVRDFLLATWPAVSSDGGGNLDRFLEANAP